MSRKLLLLDFEYNRPAEPGMGLISCALSVNGAQPLTYWLKDPNQRQGLIELLHNCRNTCTLVGYEIQLAEARCLAALGLDPNNWQWRDLLAEWRWLRNETDTYKYGRIVKNGLAYFTVPPRRRVQKRMTAEEVLEVRQQNEEQIASLQEDFPEEMVGVDEAGHSLLDCCYFFEVLNIDQFRCAEQTKNEIRNELIVKGTDEAIEARKMEILEYNKADIQDMFALANKLTTEMEKVSELQHMHVAGGEIEIVGKLDVPEIQLNLGNWCARLAKYANRGIPLDKDRLKIFLEIAPKLTQEIKENWNVEHPDNRLYRVGLSENILKLRKSMLKQSPYVAGEYVKDSSALQDLITRHCTENQIVNWPRTRSGEWSSDKKTLGTFSSGENIIKQVERHAGQLSNLKAFTADKDGKIDAMRYIGSDWKQRPDFGAHGTQTDRNAHKAKGLIFAMTHWMRILINPEPGMVLVELDYGAEEVFIAACNGADLNMLRAYSSNDVYVAFAQMSGMYPADLPIPTEAQRAEAWFKPHKKTRSVSKTCCLGQQFGMGPKSLAQALSVATGDPVDHDGALELVRLFRETYSDYTASVMRLRDFYQKKVGIILANGWRLGPDSPSILSASNVPVQGTGSCILQEACKRIDACGIDIVATMHDSITAYCPEERLEHVKVTLRNCMLQAAEAVLGRPGMKIGEAEVVRHGDWWIHGEKAERDWPKYKKYFNQ